MSLAQQIRFARAQRRARRAPVDAKIAAALAARDRADASRLAAAVVLPPDAELVAYCDFAAQTLRAPVAFFSVITPDAQILKAGHGLGGDLVLGEPMPIVNAICAIVAAHDEPLAVADVRTDPALERCIVLGGVRSYNGAPVRLAGQAVGALAVAAPAPRRWSTAERLQVERVADLVSARVADLTHRTT